MGVVRPDQAMNQLVSNEGRVARWTVTGSLTRTLKAYENHLVITIGSGDAGVLTMPDVGAAAGQHYFIYCPGTFAGGATVVIHFPDDPLVFDVSNAAGELAAAFGDTGQDLTADGDYIHFYSNGVIWQVLANRTT